MAAIRECVGCALSPQCLRKPDDTRNRQVVFLREVRTTEISHTGRIKVRMDWEDGKRMIGARLEKLAQTFRNLRKT